MNHIVEQKAAQTDPPCVLERLREGNVAYLKQAQEGRFVSIDEIRRLHAEGQRPYAIVVSCSDSRVVPELVFNAKPGEIFVVRVAGNVIGDMEAASIVYACEHLHVGELVMLGHTSCGAVEAAMRSAEGDAENAVVAAVRRSVGDEEDPYSACVANVHGSLRSLSNWPRIASLMQKGFKVHGAVYHTDTGYVEFIGLE